MSGKPSIKEISKLAGVSVATVSRVIHQNGRFSKETEKRVQDIIDSLHYTPDIIAQSMRTKVMPTVGIVLTDILDERAALFARAAQENLTAHGYQTVIFNSKRDPDAAFHFIQMMRAQHTAGFLFLSDCALNPECFGQTPVVYAWEDPLNKPAGPYSIARFDYRRGGLIGTEHLFERGCKRVAILRANCEFTSQVELYKGYMDAFENRGLKPDPDLSINVNYLRTQRAINLLRERIADKPLPFDGIFCCSYRLVIVAMSVFESLGIRMPDTVRLVGYSAMRMSRYGIMRYTAITEDEEALGRQAVDMLLTQIKQKDPPISTLIAPVSLQEGFTT